MCFKRDYLVDPTGLRELLERHLSYRRLEEAAVPFHVMATDIVEGTAVRLSSGGSSAFPDIPEKGVT